MTSPGASSRAPRSCRRWCSACAASSTKILRIWRRPRRSGEAGARGGRCPLRCLYISIQILCISICTKCSVMWFDVMWCNVMYILYCNVCIFIYTYKCTRMRVYQSSIYGEFSATSNDHSHGWLRWQVEDSCGMVFVSQAPFAKAGGSSKMGPKISPMDPKDLDDFSHVRNIPMIFPWYSHDIPIKSRFLDG